MIRFLRPFYVSLLLLMLSNCAFNKMYLQPTVLSKEMKKIKFSLEQGDTGIVAFDRLYRPTFFDAKNDTLPLDYTIESVIFKSTSGNNLNGWMLKSKTIPAKATVLHFHGNAGFLLSQYQGMTALLKYGFQVFVFDYSGFGFSEGKATRDNVLLDGESALAYVKTCSDVKGKPFVIYGQSLGGHLSAVVATKHQADIDGLVIEGAFSSHKDIAATLAGFVGRMLVQEKYSAKKFIQDFHKPVLIIHSTEDETVPFKLGKKLFEVANEPKEFYEIHHPHIQGLSYYADSIAAKIHRMLQ